MIVKRHINIPVFIPHEGCPNNCVFCNQHSITQTSEKADRDIKPEIESVLSGIADKDGSEVEIAFFGGSFTGIDRSVMTRLLRDAYEYIKRERSRRYASPHARILSMRKFSAYSRSTASVI